MKQAILTYNDVKEADIKSCTVIRKNGNVTIQFNRDEPKRSSLWGRIMQLLGSKNKAMQVASYVLMFALIGVFFIFAVVAFVVFITSTDVSEDITPAVTETGYNIQAAPVHDFEESVVYADIKPTLNVMPLSYKVTSEVVEEKEYYVPKYVDTSFKAYMDYRAITDESSEQYKMQQNAWTGLDGVRRIGDDICVALGTYYTDGCGERFEITLDTGKTFNVIVSDIKDDQDTDETNRYTMHGEGDEARACVVEFIVDIDEIGSKAKRLGDISCNNFEGEVTSIEKID